MPDAQLYLAPVYLVYAAVCTGLTIWLARILGKNGQLFLEDVFPERHDFANAVNQLLVTGFYLVNFGFALLHLAGGEAATVQGAIETLATKLGWLLVILAAMHFFNMLVFHRIRRRALLRAMTVPPMAPQAQHAPWQATPETA